MKLNMVEIKEMGDGDAYRSERKVSVSEKPAELVIVLRGETLKIESQPGDVDWLIEALTMAREALRDRTAPVDAYLAGREA